jgi:FlaA1/EpsC-like NDP-sugar epimerase
VKIVDLARDLIRLSGLEPDIDIKLKFTGLRPGEKLYEELLTAEEGTTSTSFSKIFIASPQPVDREKLNLGITLLQTAATSGDDMAIRRGLKALVETYKFQQAQGDKAPFLASETPRAE